MFREVSGFKLRVDTCRIVIHTSELLVEECKTHVIKDKTLQYNKFYRVVGTK